MDEQDGRNARIVYLHLADFSLSNLLNQLKISLSAHTCCPHIGANVSHSNHTWAALNDYGAIYTRFCHYDVVAPSPYDLETIKLEYSYQSPIWYACESS